MHHVIKGGNAFACLRAELDPGDSLKARKGAMVAMSGDLQLSAKMDGGLLRSLARKFTGESFFFQDIRAADAPGWVMLAPPQPGGIAAIELHGPMTLFSDAASFLAATDTVEVSGTIQRPFKALFGDAGYAALKVTGPGIVFLSGHGAVEPVTLSPAQDISVDIGHLLAWEGSVSCSPGKGGASWTSALLGGESVVVRVTGPGRVWLQTRTLAGLRQAAATLLPDDENSGKS